MSFTVNNADQAYLLDLARQTIEQGIRTSTQPEIDFSQLSDGVRIISATFVTLHKEGELRGCIGSLKPRQSLAEDVAHNAFASAFKDSRFFPVTQEELPEINIEISVLSPMTPLFVNNEDELLASLRPEIDGLLIQSRYHSATFLPQVWKQLPNPVEFLLNLKQKAGLQSHEWPEDIQCFRYNCFKFSE